MYVKMKHFMNKEEMMLFFFFKKDLHYWRFVFVNYITYSHAFFFIIENEPKVVKLKIKKYQQTIVFSNFLANFDGQKGLCLIFHEILQILLNFLSTLMPLHNSSKKLNILRLSSIFLSDFEPAPFPMNKPFFIL